MSREADRRADFLRDVHIFAELSDAERGRLVRSLHVRQLAHGEVLFREGDSGGALFVVESGAVSVLVRLADGEDLEIARLSRGDFFGEMSVFEKEPRSATCRAATRCHLLSLSEADLHGIMQAAPEIAAKIMRAMLAVTRRRLEDSGEFLSGMVQWGEAARRRAITDELTGLHNRRYLDEVLHDCFSRAEGSAKPLSIIMLDLDRFREINEAYSQQTGDAVIVAAAEVFRRHLRGTDIAARYGGDEFTVVMPDTPCGEAAEIGERIRRGVAMLDLLRDRGGPVTRVTTSQGVASFPEHARDLKSLREAADSALYRAKETGRDRIKIAEPMV